MKRGVTLTKNGDVWRIDVVGRPKNGKSPRIVTEAKGRDLARAAVAKALSDILQTPGA